MLALLPITTPSSSTDEFVVRLSESLDCEFGAVVGESNAVVDRIDAIESLFLRFGERESSEEMDFVGLDGSEARAFGKEGGSVFR
jgi:hypothetical protein